MNELRDAGLIDVRERLVWVLDADGLESVKLRRRPQRACPQPLLHYQPARTSDSKGRAVAETGTMRVKSGLAEMLKGGVIMDVTNAEQARIAEDAGACAVMALERVPADIRRDGGVARMSDPAKIREIQEAVDDPGDGQGPHRPLRRGADPARRSRSTTSTSPRC